MLAVTSSAKDMLHDVLLQLRGDDMEGTLRIVPLPEGQAGFAFDQPHDGDQIVELNGECVLAVEPTVANALEGITLDTVRTPRGLQLVLSR